FDVIRQLLADGMFGEIHTVLADHGEYFAAGHRILRHDLAGGPMLDLGTYPVSFAQFVLGPPARIQAAGQPHPAGVNGQVSAILSTDLAQPSCTPRCSPTPRPPGRSAERRRPCR